MDFKVYLESICAKAGDKLEFVDYSNRAHTHWEFDSSRCQYKDFYVGEDGYMHSTYNGEDYKHHTNWGFIFKVVAPQGSIYRKDVHEYCVKNGFKDGDELEFVKYTDSGHTHWRFHAGDRYKNLRVEEREGKLGIYMNLIEDGTENHLWYNWGFIFKLKAKTEKVSRPIWCGKLFGKMTEAEKGAFLLDVLEGKKAYYGDCGNSVDGPRNGDYQTVQEYVKNFAKGRSDSYHYYSSAALLKSEGEIRKLEKEIADLNQRREEKEKELAKLLS